MENNAKYILTWKVLYQRAVHGAAVTKTMLNIKPFHKTVTTVPSKKNPKYH